MARLTQAEFAKRFGEALDRLGIVQVEIARGMGRDPVTISRWRNPKRKSEPPIERDRRKLETLMGLPPGYLDGAAGADLEAIARTRTLSPSRGETAVPLGRLPGAYVQAMATLSQQADDRGLVRLADAIAAVSQVYAAATGQPLSVEPAASLSSDVEAIETAERLAKPPRAAAGAKRR